MDEDGFLYVCDRKVDLVIIGGTNVYPAEIESALAGMPGVADCAVFGIPDDRLGEALAAVIQLIPEAQYKPMTSKCIFANILRSSRSPRSSSSEPSFRARTRARSSSAGSATSTGRAMIERSSNGQLGWQPVRFGLDGLLHR